MALSPKLLKDLHLFFNTLSSEALVTLSNLWSPSRVSQAKTTTEADDVQIDRKADNVAVLVWCQLIVLKSN